MIAASKMTPEQYDALSECKTCDRISMAVLLTLAAEAAGAEVQRIEVEFAPLTIRVVITGARGMFIGVDFNGDTRQPGVFMGTWGLPTRNTNCFDPAVMGNVNPYHYRKATVVAHGFHALILTIQEHLRAGFDGTAFSAAIEAEEKRKTEAGEQVWQQTTRPPKRRVRR